VAEPPHTSRPTAEQLTTGQKIVADWIDHLIDQAVAEIKDPIDPTSLRDFYVSLDSESDRGLAILVFALAEDALKETYLNVLNPKAAPRRLFSVTGPLASAGMRIQMAFALNWITEPTYRDLRAMQRIRNCFAHTRTAVNFDDHTIAPLVAQMRPAEHALYTSAPSSADDLIPEDHLSPRQRFMARSIHTCSWTIAEMTGAPHAIRRGLSPTAHLSRGVDAMAPGHRATLIAAAEAIRHLLRRPASTSGATP
jgi:hypothetical protein